MIILCSRANPNCNGSDGSGHGTGTKDPKASDILYVGTGEASIRSNATYGNGMCRSNDGGKTIGTATGGIHLGFMRTVNFKNINDGASKTLLVAEKRVPPSSYENGGIQSDNRGWAEGWDYDNLRSTMFPLKADGEESDVANVYAPLHFEFGAAHSGGMNACFADGSVTFVSYDIDRENFNRLGHRYDGEIISENP